jgi:hypothetical protein
VPRCRSWLRILPRESANSCLRREVRQGQSLGVDVRLNETLVGMIHEIEDGHCQMGWHNFDELESLARSQGKWFPY